MSHYRIYRSQDIIANRTFQPTISPGMMDIEMKLYVAIFLLGFVATCTAIVCPPDFCMGLKCDEVKATECELENGKLKKEASFCGCCPVCVAQLGEGEPCPFVHLMGVPKKAECAEGLHCVSSKCVRLPE